MDTLKLLLRIVSAGTLLLGYGAWTWHAVREMWKYRDDPYAWDVYDWRTCCWISVTGLPLVCGIAAAFALSLVWAWS